MSTLMLLFIVVMIYLLLLKD